MSDRSDMPPIMVRAAADIGFTIEEAGHVVAALTSAAEVAQWMETRLGSLPGEQEREAADRAATIEALPQVLRPMQGTGFFRRRP